MTSNSSDALLLADLRKRIWRAMNNTPYAAMIGTRLTLAETVPVDVTLAEVAAWIEELGPRLAKSARDAGAEQEELSELRAQRAAIRAFLGTDRDSSI